jgi:hypothetical protein
MSERLLKRSRSQEASLDDVFHFARLIMQADPFKDRAPREEERAFRALFGCGPAVVLALWKMLIASELTPQNGRLTHLLWSLMYAKQYCSWSIMQKLSGADAKTLRLWIYTFFDVIALLEPQVVRVYAVLFCFY